MKQSFRSWPLAAVLMLCSVCAAYVQPTKPEPEKKAAAGGGGDITIKGDKDKRYFLNVPSGAAPAGGYKLLVVLPGGDGSEEFRPFVTNMHKNGLPPGYILAQAVAPKWSKSEEVVWPTEGYRGSPKPPVTAEELITDIIADVKGKHTVDAKHVYLLGWSSGGPPCYAMACKQGSPVTGAFVAMSVFKPETMASIDGAKGKAFYIYHSPTDFIKMNFPEAARDKLAAKGAKTTLVTYEGGHGWHGDIFGDVKKGVEWLEANSGKK